MGALQQLKDILLDAVGTPTRAAGHQRPLGHAARQQAAARRRRQSVLSRILAVALVLVVLTGASSFSMHMEMRSIHGGEGSPADDGGGGGAFSGLRSWLSLGGRRSLRERPTSMAAVFAADGVAAHAWRSQLRDVGAQGVLLHEEWWLIGGASPAAIEQQQQDDAVDGSPLNRLVRARRLQPAAMRMFNFEDKRWAPHSLTRFPPELPVGRWAVASLLNRAKKKESSIFLVGGVMSSAQAAARQANATAAAAAAHLATGGTGTSGGAGGQPRITTVCPLASDGVYSLNVGKGKIRALPPLPGGGRYGGTAVVAGARLHYFGGWATPNARSRLSAPAADHWSIGLNADGSSAPEWQEEVALPPELRGIGLKAVVLSREADGEPTVFAWSSPTSSSNSFLDGSSNPACHADGLRGARARTDAALQLWSFAGTTGWKLHGDLPGPVGADFQCAVGATSHQLLAVGAVERAGLFSQRRGIWQYDAYRDSWSRAGWAPVAFEGHLCALHEGRLFVNTALPREPDLEDDELAAVAAEEAGAAAVASGDADVAPVDGGGVAAGTAAADATA